MGKVNGEKEEVVGLAKEGKGKGKPPGQKKKVVRRRRRKVKGKD